MIELKGKYGEAKVFTDNVDDVTISQIINMLNARIAKDNVLRIMPDCHMGKGSTIGTTIKLNGNKRKWRVCPNVTGVDIGCLDAETEYLTKNGWKKINSYNDEDEIMIYDSINDISYFEKPKAYIVKKCDEFNYYKNSKGLDQMVCDEHNMLVFSGTKSRGYNKKLIHPKELNMLSLEKGYHGFKTSYNLYGGGIDYSMEEIKLIAMISADATYRGVVLNDKHTYEVHLTKQRKIDRTIELLNNNNIGYRIYKSNVDKSTFISFKTKRFYSKDLSVFFKASKEQLKVLYSEALLWDGHTNEKDSFYTTTSKVNADVIQFAINSNNIRAGLYTTKYDEDWADCYQVRLTKNNIVGYSKKSTRIKSQDGFKYCFSVSTSTFVARRNNKVFLTGNCGIMMYKLSNKNIDLKMLDEVVNKHIPSGHSVRQEVYEEDGVDECNLSDLKISLEDKHLDRIKKSRGSLGSGNHYVELAKDEEGFYWLSVHSGSRYLGVLVAKHYQTLAEKHAHYLNNELFNVLIRTMKKNNREHLIEERIKQYKENVSVYDRSLSYLNPNDLMDYLNDMEIAQNYALLNRQTMLDIIVKEMELEVIDSFDSIHNYIDITNGIIRKGATSAQKGERLVIPLNMRDGSLICEGKGNEDWNYSAPHGAGRVKSRSQAKKDIKMETYTEQMKDIYTTSVTQSTLDEAPDAYKPANEIIENIKDTVEIIHVLKPVYNFKAK